jgi:hypothetical protein
MRPAWRFARFYQTSSLVRRLKEALDVPIESLPDMSDVGWTVASLRSCVEAQNSEVDGNQIAFQPVEGVGAIVVNHGISYRVCVENILNDLHRPTAVCPPPGKRTPPRKAFRLVFAVQHCERFERGHKTDQADTIVSRGHDRQRIASGEPSPC